MVATILRTERLCKTFERRVRAPGLQGWVRSHLERRTTRYDAVCDLDLKVEEGESVAFIGSNGAGKSTTIKMLTGILFPTSGEATVLGLVPWKERTRLAFQIATVFGQRSQLWYDLPVASSFDLIADIYELARADYRDRLHTLVGRFELERHLATPVRKLSLGERMRCEIAASLLHRPRVLFLDEPTIGLDIVAKEEIRAVVRELNAEGVTVLLTSHDAGDVESLCQRVLVLKRGRLVVDERTQSLRERGGGGSLESVIASIYRAPEAEDDLVTGTSDASAADRCGLQKGVSS